LVVEAAEDAAEGEGLVVLDEAVGKAGSGKGVGVEYFSEPASVVSVSLRPETLYVAEASAENLHRSF
jgi:hypothetical protein